MRNLHIAFITVGDPRRRTGGYLYHARLFAGLRERGIMIDERVACGADLDHQQRAAPDFCAAFDPEHYDVVVIDALARGVCAPWVDRWRGTRPVVVLVHQLPSIAEADAAQVAIEQALEEPLLHADRLIAVSGHGRDLLGQRGVPLKRIAIVSPGFDRLPVAPDFVQPRHDNVRVLCVAQWVPRKGILTLVQAWAQGGWPRATLELIGETDADAAYAARIRAAIAMTRPGSIVVRGVVSDAALQRAYHAADVFVLPSRFEGYGMVYAEALAHGLPIVACDVGPVPELIGAAGLVVPPDDAAALAAALDRVIRDAGLQRRLAAAARERVGALPRWEDTARAFERVLRDALHDRQTAAS